MRFVCEIDSDKLAWLNARWAFLALCTAGLSIPWGTVAWRGYVSAHVWVFVDGPWSQFGGAINSTANRTYNAADGLAESFDVELI